MRSMTDARFGFKTRLIVTHLHTAPECLDLVTSGELHRVHTNLAVMHLLVRDELPFQTLKDGYTKLFLEDGCSLGGATNALPVSAPLGSRTQPVFSKASPTQQLKHNRSIRHEPRRLLDRVAQLILLSELTLIGSHAADTLHREKLDNTRLSP